LMVPDSEATPSSKFDKRPFPSTTGRFGGK